VKKALLVGFLLLNSLFTTQEAQAIENEEFWVCAVAVAGFDIAVLTTHLACNAAIAAPTPPTVSACLIAAGASLVTAAGAYIACSSFLTSGIGNGCGESPPGTPPPETELFCETEDERPSPILLDLDRNQFHLSGGPVLFDIDSDGQVEIVTWVAPNSMDAFLYLDRNGNGVVDNGLELFGNSTLLFSGDFAENGYVALAEFDLIENGGSQDGVIDAGDSVFTDLRVWIDENADGVSEDHESLSLAEAGVLSIGLDYRESPRTDNHGNEFRYIGSGWIEVNGQSKKLSTTDVFFRILAD